ncbi:uncharacterized protein FOMMEDRAFT_161080 [Fomitiporia mediterranea MF3/22]|uniref:uncharacterized protein n=1 Tax=Fomitiporia mediterranea (strain MF3/22) TaxID=694068 RepID=UPI0004409700|nr:uncharacterized protein FOMMEDRAFT_161080 [Fomitiporia mediterranea MF3/22]EJC98897.1 hypothetical protein FOMMEDRAFT_161080 [Fomitiporia mediterranea MF3/22]
MTENLFQNGIWGTRFRADLAQHPIILAISCICFYFFRTEGPLVNSYSLMSDGDGAMATAHHAMGAREPCQSSLLGGVSSHADARLTAKKVCLGDMTLSPGRRCYRDTGIMNQRNLGMRIGLPPECD